MLLRAFKLRKLAHYKRHSDSEWKKAKHRLKKWGDNQCMKRLLPPPVMRLMEVIIHLSNLQLYSQASVDAIIAAYNKKHPNSLLSRRSFYRYLNRLIECKLIKRFSQLEWNKSVITKILAPKLANTSVPEWHTNNLSNKNGSPIEGLPLNYDSNQDLNFQKAVDEMLKRNEEWIRDMS